MSKNSLKELFKKTNEANKGIRPFIAPKPCSSHPHSHLQGHGELIIKDESLLKDKLRTLRTMGAKNF